MTSPGNPESEKTRLVPLPRMKTGTPHCLAQARASENSAALAGSQKWRAGPPTLKEMRGARGMFSWMARAMADEKIAIAFFLPSPGAPMDKAALDALKASRPILQVAQDLGLE